MRGYSHNSLCDLYFTVWRWSTSSWFKSSCKSISYNSTSYLSLPLINHPKNSHRPKQPPKKPSPHITAHTSMHGHIWRSVKCGCINLILYMHTCCCQQRRFCFRGWDFWMWVAIWKGKRESGSAAESGSYRHLWDMKMKGRCRKLRRKLWGRQRACVGLQKR